MNNDDWIDGSPNIEITGEKSQYLWLLLHDQGGYPFVEIGYLYFKGTPEINRLSDEWLKAKFANRKDPSIIVPERPKLIPHLSVPGLSCDYPLSDWWNIDRWGFLPKKQIPKELEVNNE